MVALYIISAVMMLVSLIVIVVVLLQQSRRSGVGVVSGGADSFLSKNKARDLDSKLSNLTKYIAILFFVLAIAAAAIAYFMK
jgi:preprotein translocase subunit SecG